MEAMHHSVILMYAIKIFHIIIENESSFPIKF